MLISFLAFSFFLFIFFSGRRSKASPNGGMLHRRRTAGAAPISERLNSDRNAFARQRVRLSCQISRPSSAEAFQCCRVSFQNRLAPWSTVQKQKQKWETEGEIWQTMLECVQTVQPYTQLGVSDRMTSRSITACA